MTNDQRRTIRFTLNGRAVSANVANHETLVEVLQRDFALFGARESCGQGLCGCCTAIVDGVAVSGCLYLAAFVDGSEVVTIEGLSDHGALHPVQEAFVSTGAFQCGFCTPGVILMTKELIERHPRPTDDQIRHYLSGNLCRCGSYPDIMAAAKRAADSASSSALRSGECRHHARAPGNTPSGD
jgi:carbon-monoxide dehydrogenase small subunit